MVTFFGPSTQPASITGLGGTGLFQETPALGPNGGYLCGWRHGRRPTACDAAVRGQFEWDRPQDLRLTNLTFLLSACRFDLGASFNGPLSGQHLKWGFLSNQPLLRAFATKTPFMAASQQASCEGPLLCLFAASFGESPVRPTPPKEKPPLRKGYLC